MTTDNYQFEFANLVQTLARTHQTLHQRASRAVDFAMVVRNWLFGCYIVEFEQQGEDRAQYGKRLLAGLSEQLRAAGIPGCSVSNLKNFRQFYESMPHIRQTLSGEFTSNGGPPIGMVERLGELPASLMSTLSGQFRLGWSHYLVLMGLKKAEERRFYEIEAEQNGWTVRELERQIASALYERLALSRDPSQVRQLAEEGQVIQAPQDAVKDPYVLEFLGLEPQAAYSETDLESAIIDKLEHFLLELGKGFLFEARQKRFTFDEDHFFVDLVFYNRLLRCYVLIDLKLDKLTHQDLGQMQMYVNYFDRHVRTEGENPTLGIVLCKRKKDALIELTLPKDANIFASKYQLYLPSKDELRQQLEDAVREAEAQHRGTP